MIPFTFYVKLPRKLSRSPSLLHFFGIRWFLSTGNAGRGAATGRGKFLSRRLEEVPHLEPLGKSSRYRSWWLYCVCQIKLRFLCPVLLEIGIDIRHRFRVRLMVARWRYRTLSVLVKRHYVMEGRASANTRHCDSETKIKICHSNSRPFWGGRKTISRTIPVSTRRPFSTCPKHVSNTVLQVMGRC